MESEVTQMGQLVLGIIFISLGGLFVLMNLAGIIHWYITKKNFTSGGFLGGIFLTIGLLIIPVPFLNSVWWFGFIVDYTWGEFIYFLFFTACGREVLSECWKRKKNEDDNSHYNNTSKEQK